MSEPLRIDDIVAFTYRHAGAAAKVCGIVIGINGRSVSVLSGSLVYHVDASEVRLVERAT